jgi:hypothetical protein
MGKIDDFLEDAAPGYKRELARVNIVGGDDKPFYCAQMRSFWREGGGPDAVVTETFGLRSLLLNAQTQKVSSAAGSHDLSTPTLLRAYARPRDFGEESDGVRSRELYLWEPSAPIQGALREGEPLLDLVVAPHGRWPNQQTQNIRLPHLRLVEGRGRIELELENQLAKFLGYHSATSTLFGGLQTEVKTADGIKLVAATLVPEGIEFRGRLPDPTRDFPGGQPNGMIEGVFRLECDTRRTGGPSYLLRLVDVDKAQEPMINATESRIAGALASLGTVNAPVAIRYDKRPRVPPLLWRLRLAGKALGLIATEADGDFAMEIDTATIDARVKTQGQLGEEEQGLATIFANGVTWRRTKAPAVELIIDAGDPAMIDDNPVEVAFTKEGNAWLTTMSEVTRRPFWAPLAATAERLLDLYRAAGAISQSITRAPYVFMPICDGWLQIALPAAASKPDTAAAKEFRPSSAMSGRIVVSHRGQLRRGLVLDDAYAIRISIDWRKADGEFTAKTVRLAAGKPKGQLLGFLFFAETSPTAREALPTLRGGSAATRDLPLWFGTQPSAPYLHGDFSWKQATDEFTAEIRTEMAPGLSAEATPTPIGPSTIAWLPAGPSPFITNFPLTRSLPSASEPSLSRGLFPREITSTTFDLSSEAGAGLLPRFSAKTQRWFEVFAPAGTRFHDDTLVLPTLAGVEFQPAAKEAPSANVFMTTLRFDLPILDELFAWSDPPKKAGPATGDGEGDGREGISLPTALEPLRLAEVWRLNRNRMALTRTQSAHATGWIPAGKAGPQAITSLIETYTWTPSVAIHAGTAGDPYGHYLLDGVGYRLDKAAEALGGDVPVSFGIDGDDIAAGGAAFQVAGFAANLYRSQRWNVDLLWDSRGFAVAPEAKGGERIAGARRKGKEKIEEQKLIFKTLVRPEVIKLTAVGSEWSFAAPLAFFARDLPLAAPADAGGNGELTFDGMTNPVEVGRGTDGQAFDQGDFPLSLHEWRFFEIDDGDHLRRHDLQWGPFSFKPLRLEQAAFDGSGKLTKVSVIGSLRLDRAHDAESDGPFGPDEVYLRGDLFRLAITRKDGNWAYQWDGVGVEDDEQENGRVRFIDRSPTIALSVELKSPPTVSFLRSVAHVAGTLTVDIATKTAVFEARLFGSDFRLTGLKVTPSSDGFVAEATVAPALDSGATGVVLRPSRIAVSVNRGGKRELEVGGRVVVLPKPKPEDQVSLPAVSEPLIVLEASLFRWLGVTAGGDNAMDIDHRTGLFSWSRRFDVPAGEPLLGLAADMLKIAGAAGFIAGEPKTGQKLDAIAMSSAWIRVAAIDAQSPEQSVSHTLVAALEGTREHALEVTWTKEVTCPIRWPVGQVRAYNYAPLPPDWLDPAAAMQDQRSRTIAIKEDANTRAKHVAYLNLRRHRIDADYLTIWAGKATPVIPLRLLAVVRHTLKAEDGKRSAHWYSLDHVVITSPDLMARDTKTLTFGPRGKGGSYRAETHPEIKQGGILPLDLAAAGFHDRFLADRLWIKGNHTAILIGGAVTLFPTPPAGGKAFVAVVPWLDMNGLKELNIKSGTWRVAAADLWPATAMQANSTLPNIVVGIDLDGAAIEQQFAEGRFAPQASSRGAAPAQIVPVEQAYFEKWDGKPQKMTESDLASAPFFIRALMAIDARWHADSGEMPAGGYDWRAVTLQVGRLLKDGENTLAPALAALSVTIRTDPGKITTTTFDDVEQMAVASLIVLSRKRATQLPGYRRIPASVEADLAGTAARGEVVETAANLDPAALFAVRQLERHQKLPSFAMRSIGDVLSVASPGKILTAEATDLGPSAALGWPTPTGTGGIHMYAPTLGGEMPVLSHAAGFAARFQAFGWPAFAPNAAPKSKPSAEEPEALYLSFANHIVYDRGTVSDLSFDGPPARHLMPNIARRRAPDRAAASAMLGAILRPSSDKIAGAEPILPPAIERATVGRRPGVLDASTASLTLPADETLFDRDHPRFGRPANSGPVAAHQLRNPRSPVLPTDEIRDLKNAQQLMQMEQLTLNLRRRTYLSIADLDLATGQLALFRTHAGSADVVRFEQDEGGNRRHDRATFFLDDEDEDPKKHSSIPVNWAGKLSLTIELRTIELPPVLPGQGLAAPKLVASGRLEVGGVSFPFLLTVNSGNSPPTKSIQLELQDELGIDAVVARPQDVQAELLKATADTQIRVVLELTKPSAASAPSLPAGPRTLVVLPLTLDPGTRRVIPVRTTTIMFGDPSYDRQLASQAASDSVDVIGDGKLFLLSADRRQYDPGLSVYFAAGKTTQPDGAFDESDKSEYTLSIYRLPPQLANGDQPAPERLVCAGIKPNGEGSYKLAPATVFELALKRLVRPDQVESDRSVAALKPGDRLELTARPHNSTKEATIVVDIVAEPVIAPPPSVYTVIETAKDKTAARAPLHAAAPLPQKIEFPDLLRDLALEHVRRRALFVWQYAKAEAEGTTAPPALDLLKFDRSGGAQLLASDQDNRGD